MNTEFSVAPLLILFFMFGTIRTKKTQYIMQKTDKLYCQMTG